MAFVRLVVLGFIVLSMVYFLVSIYSRSVRREKLEDRWRQENPDTKDEAARNVFVEQGMSEYNAGIRPKLILLVYVIPVFSVGLVHYLTTY